MSASRHGRFVARLIAAAIALVELRALIRAAVHLVGSGAHGAMLAGGSSAIWLLIAFAVAVGLLLRETGRGLASSLLAGELVAGAGIAAQSHHLGLPVIGALPAVLPVLIGAGAVTFVAGYTALRLLVWVGACRIDLPRREHRITARPAPPANASPPPAPLVAGWSGRGPPAGICLTAA